MSALARASRLALLLWVAQTAAIARAQPALGSIEQAIVGGRAYAADAPSATALIGTCDATLIAPDLLVTAAHCLGDRPGHASFGHSAESASEQIEIAECVGHPLYGKQPGYDLAFCRLRQSATSVQPVEVIGACESNDEGVMGAELILVGHGYPGKDDADATLGRVERWVDVRVDATESEGRDLIVGDDDHGGCHGDSGGSALMVRTDGSERLVGVISRRGPSDDGLDRDCASKTILSALRPQLSWLRATARFEPRACGSRPPAEQGCNVASAPPSTGSLLLLAVLWLARRRATRASSAVGGAAQLLQHALDQLRAQRREQAFECGRRQAAQQRGRSVGLPAHGPGELIAEAPRRTHAGLRVSALAQRPARADHGPLDRGRADSLTGPEHREQLLVAHHPLTLRHEV